jgi:hypothetical protein
MIGTALVVGSGLTLAAIGPLAAAGQDEPAHHGRKYKAPPVTSHVEVTVVKAFNGKPISNAAVIFRPVKDGKDEGNLEVKTDPDGKAIIDVIATGSEVQVQVIANGFATFGQNYTVDTATKEIAISMVRPKPQVSTYTDKIEERKPGVQEPAKPKTPPATAAKPPETTTPLATTPPQL